MLSANETDPGPLGLVAGPPTRPERKHRISLCCAVSVEPMVSEVARCLEGLGFDTTVVCGAAARASLLGVEDIDEDEPTIHVVCVQQQLRDRVLGPLRRALADRDRPNQHLFVTVLDVAMPLAMVGPIRKFADALERPYHDDGEELDVQGAERRQWREHFGARRLTELPTRDYRPIRIVDRTAATAPSEPAKAKRRRTFTRTGPIARVGATGKYKAITAGHVTELEDAEEDLDVGVPEAIVPTPRARTARYRIDDALKTARHNTLDSLAASEQQAGPPRVGLASLLIDGPMPAPGDGSAAVERALLTSPPPATAKREDESPSDAEATTEPEEPTAEDASAIPAPPQTQTQTQTQMAKLALRKVRTPTGAFPVIVEKPLKKTAFGERHFGTGPHRMVDSRAEPEPGEPVSESERIVEALEAAVDAVVEARDQAKAEAKAETRSESEAEAKADESGGQMVEPMAAKVQAPVEDDNTVIVTGGALASPPKAASWEDKTVVVTGAELEAKDSSEPRPAVEVKSEPEPEDEDEDEPVAAPEIEPPRVSRKVKVLAPTPEVRRTPTWVYALAGAGVLALTWWAVMPPNDAPRYDARADVGREGAAPTKAPAKTAPVKPAGIQPEAAPPPTKAAPPPEPEPETEPEGPGRVTPPAPGSLPAVVADVGDEEPEPAPPPEPEPETDPEPEPATSDDATDRLAAALDRRQIQLVNDLYVATPSVDGTTTWAQGDARCRGLAINGVSGWRLPWRKQLKLVAVVLGLRSGTYWSRSVLEEDDDMVYALDARTRSLGEYMKSEVTGEVICVRRR